MNQQPLQIDEQGPLQIDVGVSRMARGKEGYETNKMAFGNSFKTETLGMHELINLLAVQGYPITCVLSGEKPGPQALKRNTWTGRHTEAFVSTQLILLDDDGHAGDGDDSAVEFWKNDEFFNQYGAFFYESSSSSAELEKVRPVFILDTPIHSHLQVSEIQAAFYDRYPRIDRLTDAVRVFFGAQGSRSIHVPSNTLPMGVLMDDVVLPYRKSMIEEKRRIALERIAFIDSSRARRGDDLGESTAVRAFVKGRLDWMSDKLSGLHAGNSRNSLCYWAGRFIAGGEASHWVSDAVDLLYGAEDMIVAAFIANGYASKYGGEEEIRRVFKKGKAKGGESWDQPEFNESWFAFEIGEEVDVFNGDQFLKRNTITERKRPLGQANAAYSAYKLAGDNTLYGEWQLFAATEDSVPELDTVHPPLSPVQKEQVRAIVNTRVIEAWKAALSTLADPPLDLNLMTYLGYGYDYDVDHGTGEVSARRTALPVMVDGKMTNVEYYDLDGEYSYEYDGCVAPWVSDSDAECTVVLPNTMSAQQWWASYGTGTRVIGLPQAELSDIDSFGQDVIFVLWEGETLRDRGLRQIFNTGRNLRVANLPAPLADMGEMTREVIDAVLRTALPIV